MKSLFRTNERDELLQRIDAIDAQNERLWGKMTPAQMFRHCAIAIETSFGDKPTKQKLIGKILMPFFRKSFLGEKPFGRNSPTDPTFVVSDERDLAAERANLRSTIERFVTRGADAAGRQVHPFFGKLSGDEWGELMYKHIDHHLRQFGR